MIARPFELPATMARFWVDSSIQMMRTTSDFWAGVLLPAGRSRSASSTASPWWMPPQSSSAPSSPAFWPASAAASAWMPAWSNALSMSAGAIPSASPFLPWLPTAGAASTGNPFALWQQIWLNAAAPAFSRPWPAAVVDTPAVNSLWQPVAAAYRTANGHAMAAVLRTMADVVEPKPQSTMPAQYWPNTLGTRH